MSAAAAAPAAVRCLIPERRRLNGPVTRGLFRRTLGGLATVWVLAAVPVALDLSPELDAVGLGLLLPGGGFLYAYDPLLAVAAFVVVVASLGLWWVTGNVLLPPVAWVGTALLSALRVEGGVWEPAQVAVPVGLVALVGGGVIAERLKWRAASRRGAELNERLREIEFPVAPATGTPEVVEATPEEWRWLRLPLDLALQPIDEFEGFTRLDQFREAALRYQLNYIGYALATYQYTRTPAFTGYAAEAQRGAIEKMRDRRVWRYWALENLWGNLRWDPDPIGRDNVMYSGYYGLQIGLYEAMNGDARFSQPGALTLHWSEKRSFPYDFASLAEAEHRKMNDSALCMYPCEPNWSFSYCNAMSLNAQILHDRLHGTRHTDDSLPNFRRAYEDEFVRPDGRCMLVRSRRIGFALPFSAFAAGDGVMAYWLHPGMPDIARRTWWLMRERLVDRSSEDGARLRLSPPDLIDPGNYTIPNSGYAYAQAICSAREFGDDETADALQRGLDERMEVIEDAGRPRYRRASTYTNLLSVLARLNRENTLRDMVGHGIPEQWRTGPRLAEVAYPDVFVARAVSDGADLELVLRPGANGAAGRVTLGIEQLRPDVGYAVEGATSDRVVAGGDGRARVEVDIDDRHEVRFRPE